MTDRETIAIAAAVGMTEVYGVAGPAPDYGMCRGERQIPGVVCAAAAGGGYDVTVYVTARPVPLLALCDRIVLRVNDAVERVGLAEALADVRVVVVDIAVPQ